MTKELQAAAINKLSLSGDTVEQATKRCWHIWWRMTESNWQALNLNFICKISVKYALQESLNHLSRYLLHTTNSSIFLSSRHGQRNNAGCHGFGNYHRLFRTSDMIDNAQWAKRHEKKRHIVLGIMGWTPSQETIVPVWSTTRTEATKQPSVHCGFAAVGSEAVEYSNSLQL